MVDLKKELEKDKETLSKQLKNNSPINEAKQLLLGESQEDARIMRHMGGNSTLMQMEEFTGNAVHLEKLEKEYGQVFQVHQIQALCMRYKLRFLNSNLFIGKMDVQVTSMTKQFAKETNTDLNEHDLKTRFFILAEPKAFRLQKQSVSHFQGLKDLRAFMKMVMTDPVLFYKIDDDHFRMIHKWGNDFTIYRALLGFKWLNPDNLRTFNFFIHIPMIAAILGLVAPTFILTNPITTILGTLAASALGATLRNLWYVDRGGFLSEKQTSYHDGFFTSYNWNSPFKLK